MSGQLAVLVFLASFSGAALAILGWLIVRDVVVQFRRRLDGRKFAAQVEQHLRDKS